MLIKAYLDLPLAVNIVASALPLLPLCTHDFNGQQDDCVLLNMSHLQYDWTDKVTRCGQLEA